MDCVYYAGNQYCNLHRSKVASAYCGDICEEPDKLTRKSNTSSYEEGDQYGRKED